MQRVNEWTECVCRIPALAEAGWDVWERLAALEPADPSKGSNGAGQLEASLADMTAVLEQRNRLQVAATALLPSLRLISLLPVCSLSQPCIWIMKQRTSFQRDLLSPVMRAEQDEACTERITFVFAGSLTKVGGAGRAIRHGRADSLGGRRQQPEHCAGGSAAAAAHAHRLP